GPVVDPESALTFPALPFLVLFPPPQYAFATGPFCAARQPCFVFFLLMQLTKKFVKAKNPCAAGYRWFIRNQQGQGDYQALLDALVADGRIDDACWLLDQF